MTAAHLSAGRPWVARPRSPGPSAAWDVWAPSAHGGSTEVPVAFFLSEQDARAVAAAHETGEGLKRAYGILLALVGDSADPRVEPSLEWMRSALKKAGVL